jgi:hypothetical protein
MNNDILKPIASNRKQINLIDKILYSSYWSCHQKKNHESYINGGIDVDVDIMKEKNHHGVRVSNSYLFLSPISTGVT